MKWQALECAKEVTWEAKDPSSISLGRDTGVAPYQPPLKLLHWPQGPKVVAPGPAGREAQSSEDYISQDAFCPRLSLPSKS